MPVAHLQIKYKASVARVSEATSKSTPMRRIRSARCDRAADQSDEVAPLHSLVSPVLKIEWIAHFDGSRRLLRCGISIQLTSQLGQSLQSQAVPNDGPRPVSSKPGPQFRKTDACESRASSSASRFTAAHAGFFHLEPIR